MAASVLSAEFVPPPDLEARIARLCLPVDPRPVLRAEASATAIVALWVATRRHQAKADHLAWVVLLDALLGQLAARPPGLREAMKARRMRLGRTLAEIELQLGSRLYHLGWMMLNDKREDEGRPLLEAAIATFDRLQAGAVALPQHVRVGWLGMRGVAAVVLARRDPDDAEDRLRLAVHDLDDAEALGDTSSAHFLFLAEAHRRLHEFSGGDHLEHAERALSEAESHGHIGRDHHLERSHFVARRAFERLEAGEREDARVLFTEAVAACDQAMTTHGTTGDDLVCARRGQWRVQGALLEPDTKARSTSLRQAADELRTSPLVGMSLPRTLTALAEEARVAGDWTATRDAASEAMAYLQQTDQQEEALIAHLEGLLLQADVWVALEDEISDDLLGGVQALLDRAPTSNLSLAAVSHGLRALSETMASGDLETLCVRGALLARSDVDDQRLSPEARLFAASHGAGLLWRVAHVRDDIELIRLAAGLFEDGLALTTEPAVEMLSSAGECFLRLSRLTGGGKEPDREDAIRLLDDAAGYLRSALDRSTSEDEHVPMRHSMLGEVLGRRYVWTHDEADADAAIEHLGTARGSGDARRVDDLQANVLYRRGVRRGSATDLERALALKESAARGGTPARENYSVRAAAEVALYDLVGDREHLRRAAAYSATALDIDPSWPWPLLQLAEIAERRPPVDPSPEVDGGSGVAELALAGRRQDLLDLAAERAVAATEFTTARLGGRGETFLLDDRHRLLAQTLVLKPSSRATAEREWRRARALAAYFAEHGDAGMRLPEAISIVPAAQDVVYVMRRANGVSLAARIGRHLDGLVGPPMSQMRRAIRMLALYHASAARATDAALTLWSGSDRRRAARAYGQALVRVGATVEQARIAQAAFKVLLPALPTLIKKDAHPENWLTDGDTVVMIDLEAVGREPVGYEAVLLIDDCPFLPVDGEGFTERLRLLDEYFETLNDMRALVEPPESGRRLYLTFALEVAVRGLAQTLAAERRADSATSHRMVQARRRHFRALLTWLANGEAGEADIATSARLAGEGLSELAVAGPDAIVTAVQR